MHKIADMPELESLPNIRLDGSASTGLINHGEPGDDGSSNASLPRKWLGAVACTAVA